MRWDLAARENGMVETIGANSVWDQGKQNKVIQHSQTPPYILNKLVEGLVRIHTYTEHIFRALCNFIFEMFQE